MPFLAPEVSFFGHRNPPRFSCCHQTYNVARIDRQESLAMPKDSDKSVYVNFKLKLYYNDRFKGQKYRKALFQFPIDFRT